MAFLTGPMTGFTLFHTSMSRRKFSRPGTVSRAAAAVCTALLAGAVAVTPATGQTPAATPAPAALYRVFLQDGGVLVSYGEFARVSDRVVLSIPIGGTEASPVLHVISIAEKTSSGSGRMPMRRRRGRGTTPPPKASPTSRG